MVTATCVIGGPRKTVKFNRKTKVLVEQYNGYSPVPGHFLNGELTLGENIADNVGIVMALKAYRLSLEGNHLQFSMAGRVSNACSSALRKHVRSKSREQRALALIKTDPHSPGNSASMAASEITQHSMTHLT
jgi:predicted metalloendopeptidase